MLFLLRRFSFMKRGQASKPNWLYMMMIWFCSSWKERSFFYQKSVSTSPSNLTCMEKNFTYSGRYCFSSWTWTWRRHMGSESAIKINRWGWTLTPTAFLLLPCTSKPISTQRALFFEGFRPRLPWPFIPQRAKLFFSTTTAGAVKLLRGSVMALTHFGRNIPPFSWWTMAI